MSYVAAAHKHIIKQLFMLAYLIISAQVGAEDGQVDKLFCYIWVVGP